MNEQPDINAEKEPEQILEQASEELGGAIEAKREEIESSDASPEVKAGLLNYLTGLQNKWTELNDAVSNKLEENGIGAIEMMAILFVITEIASAVAFITSTTEFGKVFFGMCITPGAALILGGIINKVEGIINPLLGKAWERLSS